MNVDWLTDVRGIMQNWDREYLSDVLYDCRTARDFWRLADDAARRHGYFLDPEEPWAADFAEEIVEYCGWDPLDYPRWVQELCREVG